MFLLHASTFLSFLLLLLLLLHFFYFLFTKLFTYLCHRATSRRDVELNSVRDETENGPEAAARESSENEDLIADVILGGRGLLDGSLLVEQGRDSNESSCFKVENNFVSESTYASPLEDLQEERHAVEESDHTHIKELLAPPDCPSPTVSTADYDALEAKETEVEDFQINEEKNLLKDKSFSVIHDKHSDSKKFQRKEIHWDEENYGESLTGESTSESSIEWRSSKNLETEYPSSSSSRRSSGNWESYTLFRKYEEEMIFFDRISKQKLNETESLRSIKYQPRSLYERIAHEFMTKDSKYSRRGRHPYQELESAYVSQICLTWEALDWNYNNFRRATSNKNAEDSGCPARITQQFQLFQVLLQRFNENEPFENEPCEHGRRPEVYTRMRIASPKLLQVPEFRDSEGDENKEDMSSKTPSSEFRMILKDAIQTFMNFLEGDRERHGRIFRAIIKKKLSLVDPNYFRLVKKANRKKMSKLKKLGKQRNEEEEMEILMSLIDMEVVSRVLRMPEISGAQLQWCEEKMNKVRIWDDKLQRDSSPLFFPAD